MEIIEDAAGIRLRETIPRVIPVASPGAGLEFTQPVPGGVLWLVNAVLATLTTSAVVATRIPSIRLSDGTTPFAQLPSAGSQAATLVNRHGWYRNLSSAPNVVGNINFAAGFPSVPVFGGTLITSVTTAIDVGDTWTAIAFYVLEIVERPYDVELESDLAQLRGITSNAYPTIPWSL